MASCPADCVSAHSVLHGYSLLQCTSEYFESPAAVSMETREADVIGGYPEHAQICLLEPVSDADYVFSSVTISIHKPDPATILRESIRTDF